MFYPDWLILRILHQSFEIERPKGQRSWFIIVFFIHSTAFLFVNRDGIYVPPSNWLHTIWIYFVAYATI